MDVSDEEAKTEDGGTNNGASGSPAKKKPRVEAEIPAGLEIFPDVGQGNCSMRCQVLLSFKAKAGGMVSCVPWRSLTSESTVKPKKLRAAPSVKRALRRISSPKAHIGMETAPLLSEYVWACDVCQQPLAAESNSQLSRMGIHTSPRLIPEFHGTSFMSSMNPQVLSALLRYSLADRRLGVCCVSGPLGTYCQ